MPHSRVEQLWNGVQQVPNLKEINLEDSKHLTSFPEMFGAVNLESLNLEDFVEDTLLKIQRGMEECLYKGSNETSSVLICCPGSEIPNCFRSNDDDEFWESIEKLSGSIGASVDDDDDDDDDEFLESMERFSASLDSDDEDDKPHPNNGISLEENPIQELSVLEGWSSAGSFGSQ
ncbi:hypothetical protein QYF36_022905 [Acer negundo]|nr:hypothetical protein QYF36_022905 [Acer negundo]